MLEQVLVGEVVNAHRLFAGKSVSGRHHGNARHADSEDRRRVTSV
jgi:hypothetical protein